MSELLEKNCVSQAPELRPPKRARAIAEKLGLETDWNTAISLLPLKKSPLESLEQRSEWDVKAKLPHGVGEIRQHLEDIDDVPLRVPMFTDCDPASSFEMLGILQEHGEIAGALGSAYSSHNFSMFLRAHASIAIQTPPSTAMLQSHKPDGILFKSVKCFNYEQWTAEKNHVSLGCLSVA